MERCNSCGKTSITGTVATVCQCVLDRSEARVRELEEERYRLRRNMKTMKMVLEQARRVLSSLARSADVDNSLARGAMGDIDNVISNINEDSE